MATPHDRAVLNSILNPLMPVGEYTDPDLQEDGKLEDGEIRSVFKDEHHSSHKKQQQ